MYNSRISTLRNKLTEAKLDALLVSNFYNVFYLSGFKTLTTNEREAFLMVTKNNVYLFTDERYVDKDSKLRITDYELRIKLIEPHKGLLTNIQEVVEAEKFKSVGFEAEDLRFFEYEGFKNRMPNINWISTQRLIVAIREIKDNKEVEKVKEACVITDQCLVELSKIISLGKTEKQIVFEIEMWIKKKGSDLAFDPIVAVDENSAVPHYNTKTGRGVIKNGSVILIDFGVKHEDYLSDVTRMFFIGKPKDDVMKAYKVLQGAQEKTVEEVKKISSLSSVDEYCRRIITEEKYPTYPHSTGHGVGLEIHEYPKVSFNSDDLKKDGQVVTIEPGIYFTGKWGMRVEDTVVVENGKAEALTKFSKEAIIL